MTSDLAVLDGGYAMWHVTYGVTCVGKYRRKPSSGHSPQSSSGGGEGGRGSQVVSMDYPTFPDIK